jgi:hypothetical protein
MRDAKAARVKSRRPSEEHSRAETVYCLARNDLAAPGSEAIQSPASTARGLPRQHDKCWRDAVVYQIYVRSFADSNGDGGGEAVRGALTLDRFEAVIVAAD